MCTCSKPTLSFLPRAGSGAGRARALPGGAVHAGAGGPPVALTVNLASLFKARERRSLGADLLASAGCVLATAGCLELFVCATLALGMVQSQFDRRCRGPVGPQQTAQADRPAQRPALPTATAQPVQQALSTQLAARQ